MDSKLARFRGRVRLSGKQYSALQRTLKKHEPTNSVQVVKAQVKPVRPAPHLTVAARTPRRTQRPIRARASVRKAKWLAFIFIVAFGALLGSQNDNTDGNRHSSLSKREPTNPRTVPVGRSDELGVSVSLRPKLSPGFKEAHRATVSPPSSAVSPRIIRVVDGDTIRLTSNGQRIRLVGFNTPETWKPRCAQGKALGDQATARLAQLLRNAKTAEVEFVRCSCKPGTHGTKNCNFGRACAYLRINGKDVGETLIAEGLAARFVCGPTSCPPLPRPWCE